MSRTRGPIAGPVALGWLVPGTEIKVGRSVGLHEESAKSLLYLLSPKKPSFAHGMAYSYVNLVAPQLSLTVDTVDSQWIGGRLSSPSLERGPRFARECTHPLQGCGMSLLLDLAWFGPEVPERTL